MLFTLPLYSSTGAPTDYVVKDLHAKNNPLRDFLLSDFVIASEHIKVCLLGMNDMESSLFGVDLNLIQVVKREKNSVCLCFSIEPCICC